MKIIEFSDDVVIHGQQANRGYGIALLWGSIIALYGELDEMTSLCLIANIGPLMLRCSTNLTAPHIRITGISISREKDGFALALGCWVLMFEFAAFFEV